MKILCLPDLHLTNNRPENRIDDYEETLKKKFSFILQTAEKENCELILQPGDFFDSPSVSYDFLCWIINEIKSSSDIPIITTVGQHDLRYRNYENTALRALSYACYEKLTVSKSNDEGFQFVRKKIKVYASPFNSKIPEITDSNFFNILITHRMIIQEKIWEGQTDAEPSNLFLRNNKFNLIISGDNHQSFYQSYKGRYLFNCGSLMRSTIAQINHKPFIVLFDTDKPENFKTIYIPIAAPKRVFNIQKVSDKKELNASLDSFCKGLSTTKEMGLVIDDNLKMYYEENKIEPEIIQTIEENMNGTF